MSNQIIKTVAFVACVLLAGRSWAQGNECTQSEVSEIELVHSSSRNTKEFVKKLSEVQKKELLDALTEELNEDDYEEVDIDGVESSTSKAPNTWPTVEQ